jgi:hypothetical protein
MKELIEIKNLYIEETIKALAKRYKMNENEAKIYVMSNGEGNNNIKRRGRPKGGEKEMKKKGPRGRPPMEAKIKTSNVGEDLIARLIARAKKEYSQE